MRIFNLVANQLLGKYITYENGWDEENDKPYTFTSKIVKITQKVDWEEWYFQLKFEDGTYFDIDESSDFEISEALK